jgi:hypothetical protein
MQQKKTSGCFSIASGIVLIFILYAILSPDSKGSGSKIPDETEAYITAQDYVKQELKAPATAKFSGYSCKEEMDSTYFLNVLVDSENSFGALLRSSWTVKMKWLGGEWEQPTSWQLIEIDGR